MLLLYMSLLTARYSRLNPALANTDAIQLHLKTHSVECNVIFELEYQHLQFQHCNIQVSNLI